MPSSINLQSAIASLRVNATIPTFPDRLPHPEKETGTIGSTAFVPVPGQFNKHDTSLLVSRFADTLASGNFSTAIGARGLTRDKMPNAFDF